MITVVWPWVLVALPLPFLARRWLPPAPPRPGKALRLPFYRQLPGSGGDASTHAVRGRQVAAWLVWVLLVLAAARPQWLANRCNCHWRDAT